MCILVLGAEKEVNMMLHVLEGCGKKCVDVPGYYQVDLVKGRTK